MTHDLTPMQVCERLIGRPEVIARAIGYQEKAPYHWRRARSGRAAGDLPSTLVMRALLAYAAAKGIPLTADDLIWGADAADIDARLANTSSNSTARLPLTARGAVATGGGEAAPATFMSSRGGHSPVMGGANLQADAPLAAGQGCPAAKPETAAAPFAGVRAHG